MKLLNRVLIITGVIAMIIAIIAVIDFFKVIIEISDLKQAYSSLSDAQLETLLEPYKKDASFFRFIINVLFYLGIGASCIMIASNIEKLSVNSSRSYRKTNRLEERLNNLENKVSEIANN